MTAVRAVADRRPAPRPGVLGAAAVVFLAVTGPSWLLWQVLEGGRGTLLGSQFRVWLAATVVLALVVVAVGAWRWRRDDVRAGTAVGAVAAGFAVLVGLLVDALTSAS